MKPADAARAIPRGPTAVGPLRHSQETYANPFLAWPAGRIVQLCPGQALLPDAIWGKGPTKGRGKKRPVALAHNGANGNNKQRPAGQQPFDGPGRHVWPCKTGLAEPPNGILGWQWCMPHRPGAPAAKQARRSRPPAGGGMPAAPCALLPTVQGRAQRACAPSVPSAPSAGPAAGLGSSSERYFRLSASMRSASTSCLSWARACCMAPP